MTSEYLSIAEAASLLGITKWALYKAVKTNRLPCTKMFGMKVLLKSDVQNFSPGPHKRRPVRGATPHA